MENFNLVTLDNIYGTNAQVESGYFDTWDPTVAFGGLGDLDVHTLGYSAGDINVKEIS